MGTIVLKRDCTLSVFTDKVWKSSNTFLCDNDDIDDFFANEAQQYAAQLFGKSYCFTLDSNPKEVVCIFTISNDSIKAMQLPQAARRTIRSRIPYPKQSLKSYPAVLIGRLGVDNKYMGQGIGSQVLDFVKSWFRDEGNKTGCRFVVVDAYNTDDVLSFYKKNDFKALFKDEKIEAEYLERNLGLNEKLHSRIMFYDLIQIKPN